MKLKASDIMAGRTNSVSIIAPATIEHTVLLCTIVRYMTHTRTRTRAHLFEHHQQALAFCSI